MLAEIDDFFGPRSSPNEQPVLTQSEVELASERVAPSERLEDTPTTPELPERAAQPPPPEPVHTDTLPPASVIEEREPGIEGQASEPQETQTTVTPPRRSGRSGAQKPPGFYSKLNSGDSVADYTACHMRAQECSRLYGEKETEEAGTAEVRNMIKVRNAAEPVDYQKLTPRVVLEALPSFIFLTRRRARVNRDHSPCLSCPRSQGRRQPHWMVHRCLQTREEEEEEAGGQKKD